MGSLKTELKNYVSKVQQFYDEAEEKASTITPSDLKDIAMAVGAVAIIATLVGVTLIVILSLIPWLITCATTLITIASMATAIAIIVALINKIS
jgi:preprotein translocase subunit Sec61beta